ncbi:MAG: VanW family protein [Clostridia bacterium]|nr:VanW family protein [Clostridia bacterium]
MSQEETHRRRRRRPAPAAPEQPQEPAEPIRIVVEDEDTPDWMVSAHSVSGAASRRAGASKRAVQETNNDASNAKPAAAGRIFTARAAAPRKAAQAEAGPSSSPKQSAPGAEHIQRPADMGAAGGTQPEASAYGQQPDAQEDVIRRPSAAKAPAVKPKKKAPARKKLTKKARARRNRTIRNGIILAACAAAVIALAVVGITNGARLMDIKKTLDEGDGVFYRNIYVNGIPLEGKTLDEAHAAVTAQVSSQMSAFRLTLRTQDGRSWEIGCDDLKMRYDVADQLDQLWSIGHSGSSSDRYEQVKALEGNAVMRYTTLSYDMTSIQAILAQIKNEVDVAPVNATRINDETRWPPYSYTDDVPGMELDITGLSEKIMQMVDELKSGEVVLTPTVKQADVTREYLEGQIVQLSTYETSIGKTGDYVEARHENIRIGTECFNHLTIKPGESVSFNKVTGKRSDPRNGYQPSLELAYGEYVEGLGGGICQVSSTLYNAVIGAGLEVTKRTQHSLPSSYVPLGLDATVSDERLDFVFKNNTGADIFIESKYYKKKNNYYATQFTIYGRPDPNGHTYKLESEVKETLPVPEPTYKPDKDATYVVYDDETKQTNKGHEGYVVDVYLVTMDAKGLELSRTLNHTDTYKAVTPVYYVGVTPRETPMPETYD